MPNLTAYIVLFMWPLVTMVLFRATSPERALIWTILGAYLFLPVRPIIDFPMLPPINKTTVATLGALVGALVVRRGWEMPAVVAGPAVPAGRVGPVLHSRFPARTAGTGEATGLPPGRAAGAAGQASPRVGDRPLLSRGWISGLIGLAVFGAVMTTLTNGDPVPAGPYFLPAMRAYDTVSMVLNTVVTLVPFVLGWAFLGRSGAQRSILAAFAIGGALYAPLMLFEVRMSPKLNVMLFGFFPHDFFQHMRSGGFRPIVFLPHGLWVGIFMAMAVLSSLALWRLPAAGRRDTGRLVWLLLGMGLLGVLVLAKSLGALVIALVLGSVVLFGGRRLAVLVAAGLAMLVLVYPMARGAGLVPVTTVTELAASVDAERAESLSFRLKNEDVLLEKANQRAAFGWGGWARGLIFDQWGNRVSVSDGAWIIEMNGRGWVGYLAKFGLLCLPLCLLALRRGYGPETPFLGVVLAANLLDLLPNATLEMITWLLAGAVAGTRLPVEAGSGAVRRADRRAGGPVAVRAMRPVSAVGRGVSQRGGPDAAPRSSG